MDTGIRRQLAFDVKKTCVPIRIIKNLFSDDCEAENLSRIATHGVVFIYNPLSVVCKELRHYDKMILSFRVEIHNSIMGNYSAVFF